VVSEPFVAGAQDEKRYRVVKDCEAWVHVVTGGQSDNSEVETDRIAERVSTPADLTDALSVDLSVASTRPSFRAASASAGA
jgi:hypothetical protein